MDVKRCDWASGSENIKYHDEEWGVPVYDDHKLFEFLILEGMQAGLSWLTILKKRENFRNAFDDFDYHKIAAYEEDKIQELLQNEGIIRNRLKVRGAKKNAIAFIAVQKEFGSFSNYLWGFVDHTPIVNHFESQLDMPTRTELSDTISKDLKKRGFTFVGTTIIYAFLEAVGVVNDHMTWCDQFHKCIDAHKK